MQDADLLFDAWVVNGRVLQPIAQGLVIQQNPRARSNQRRRGQVPVVDPFILWHRTSAPLKKYRSVDCNRKQHHSAGRSQLMRKASWCSTDTMHKPCGGTVGPDRERSFSS